jgi:hypothetical protein
MATFDMTASSTAGVGANVSAVPTVVGHAVRTIEAILDIDAMIAAGATIADGDVFQLLEIPAESVVLCAGAEVMKQFTGSCVADIDFAGGDDIVDGDSLAVAAGTYLTAGSNGQTNIVSTGAANLIGETIPGDANTAPVTVTAADTIDVTISGAAAATGRLRVYAVIADISAAHREAAVASRDNV